MKILIVDDETISRKILQKKLARIGTCTAVDGSLKAVKLFDSALKENTPYDLITLDVSMPKMDGMQLLSLIRKKEKAKNISRENRVKIIMVTSRMNISTIKECIRLGCNGYISKPVSQYQLLETLARTGLISAGDIQKSDKKTYAEAVARIINRFYNGEIKLPVLPGIVQEVKELMQGRDPSIEDLTKIVKKDMVIGSKLVSVANSALYAGVDKVENLNEALVRLGMKATYGVISTLITKELFKSDNQPLNEILSKLWLHSFACACLGKQLAEELKMKSSETVFLMGIVHDIGKMLLLKAVADLFPEESLEKPEIQLAVHEIHTTFGAAALKKMRFSKEFIQVAEFHHWNDFSDDDEKELVIIHLADHMAAEIGYGFLNPEQDASPAQVNYKATLSTLASFKQLNLDVDRTVDILQAVKTVVKDSVTIF